MSFLFDRTICRKKGRFTSDVLQEWNKKNIAQEIFDGYWEYHQEALENAFNYIKHAH